MSLFTRLAKNCLLLKNRFACLLYGLCDARSMRISRGQSSPLDWDLDVLSHTDGKVLCVGLIGLELSDTLLSFVVIGLLDCRADWRELISCAEGLLGGTGRPVPAIYAMADRLDFVFVAAV